MQNDQTRAPASGPAFRGLVPPNSSNSNWLFLYLFLSYLFIHVPLFPYFLLHSFELGQCRHEQTTCVSHKWSMSIILEFIQWWGCRLSSLCLSLSPSASLHRALLFSNKASLMDSSLFFEGRNVWKCVFLTQFMNLIRRETLNFKDHKVGNSMCASSLNTTSYIMQDCSG